MNIITTAQAACILGVSQRRIQALVTAGRLPATKAGNTWIIKTGDLKKVENRKPGRPTKDKVLTDK